MIIGNERIDQDRRQFFGRVAMAIGAAHESMFTTVQSRQPKPIVDRQFEIEFLDGEAEAYAFTFG